jgi:Transposase DDE domain
MGIITKVTAAVQALFGAMAEEVAQEHPVVLRQRKFSTATLAQTFILGFLAKPRASDEELAQTAALCGVEVTPQALEQRHTTRLADFLEALFRRATQCLVKSQKSLAPLLARFPAVLILDSTTTTLPDALRERFPGCGGSHGGGQAAMKLQVQWDLCGGALDAVAIESGRDCDYKTSLQRAPLTPGTLRIADLGYFDTEVFQRFDREGIFWLSRLQYGTSVFTPEGQRLPLLDWLGKHVGPFVDQPILMGTERRVACRIVAWRVPQEVADRRRQKLIAEARRKDGRVPSKERLAWCDWMILVTNVGADVLTPKEIAVLYRARWQIELLFKRWKSLGLIAELTGSTVARQLVRLWSRLLAVLMQHWLLLSSVWGNPRCSLSKACEAIRRHALMLAATVNDPAKLTVAIEDLSVILRATAKQNKRRKPSTFELLNNPELLEYSLT